MTTPASDPTNGPAPTPRPRTPALVRGGVAALALGIAGCGAGDAQPPQVPPQAVPADTAVVPPQAPPPPDLTAAPPPPQVAPPPSPKNIPSPPPNAR